MITLAAVAATMCLAQPEKSEFERYLFAATELFEKLEFERSYEALLKAKAKSRGVKDDVVVALYEGILKAELSGPADAEAAFRTALLLDPDATLPVKVSPSVRELFERVRADAKKAFAKQPPVEDTKPPVELPPRPTPPPPHERAIWPLLTGIAALAAFVGAGVALYVVSSSDKQQLQTAPHLSLMEGQAAASRGALFEPLGIAGMAVGGALGVAGLVLWLVLP